MNAYNVSSNIALIEVIHWLWMEKRCSWQVTQ